MDYEKKYNEASFAQKPELCDIGRWDEQSYNNGIHHILQNPEAYGLTKQKPAEWSEEDELLLNAAIYMVEGRDNYDVYNKNTDAVHEQGTKDDLIEFVLSENYNLIYGVGESMSTVTDDYGNELIYNLKRRG